MIWFKPQDTEYGGILYRSKLEARWALFFDENKISHKYELAKVDLGIDKYTPDFWLPEFQLWVEIKPYKQDNPRSTHWTHQTHSKCYRLSIESGKPVLLIQGNPGKHIIDLFDCRARRKFVHRTVVDKREIKPSKEFLRFDEDNVAKDELILVHPQTSEVVKFTREIDLRPK